MPQVNECSWFMLGAKILLIICLVCTSVNLSLSCTYAQLGEFSSLKFLVLI